MEVIDENLLEGGERLDVTRLFNSEFYERRRDKHDDHDGEDVKKHRRTGAGAQGTFVLPTARKAGFARVAHRRARLKTPHRVTALGEAFESQVNGDAFIIIMVSDLVENIIQQVV